MTHLDSLLSKIDLAARPSGKRLNSIRVYMHITEHEFSVDVLYHALRPHRTRAEVKMEGQTVFLEAYDGERAWQIQGDGEPSIASPEGTAALRRGAFNNLYTLGELPAEGHRLELLDPTDFDGRLHPTVRVTFDDDHVVHHYYDPDTLLLVRTRDHHALHPDLDPTIKWTETRMSDYRDVAGYHRYFREETVDLKTGQIVQKAIVRDVGCNVAVAPGLFAMPG